MNNKFNWRESKKDRVIQEVYIKLPNSFKNDGCMESKSHILITLKKGIFSEKNITSTFWAFNRGVEIISEHEYISDISEAKKITEKRFAELFNIG